MRAPPEGPGPSYRFGRFRLAPAERVLTCDDAAVALPPKLFDVLVLLVREDERLVPRERILASVWPDVVVGEANLRQAIWQLRRILRGSAVQDRECIETVPRHGYRFVTPVRLEDHEPTGATMEPPVGQRARRSGTRPSLRLLLLGVACLLGGGRGHRDPSPQPSPTVAAAGDTRHAVAILRLQTHSGDPRDGWIADAFTEILRTELEGSAALRVVPAEIIEREAAALSLPRVLSLSAQSLSRLRERIGGDTVVAGSLIAAGPEQDARLRVDLLVQCTRSRAGTVVLTHSGARRELSELAVRAARDLRRVLSDRRSLPTAG